MSRITEQSLINCALVRNNNSSKKLNFTGINSDDKNIISGQKSLSTSDISAGLLKSYFLGNSNQVFFGRSLKLHNSWGANYQGNNRATFKVWAPYAKEMYIEIRKKEDGDPVNDPGQNLEDYVKKLSWHYKAGDSDKARRIKMKSYNGVFYAAADKVSPGNMYRYVFEDKNCTIIKSKDPRSKSQPFDSSGWSEIIDNNGFKWTDDAWVKGKDPRKLRTSGTGTEFGAPPKMVLEQIHIGTFTQEGDFKAAAKKLDQIAEDGIANTVHILPIAEFFKERNWGYDGVDLFAPESSYTGGNPDYFKKFVDYAHKKGINVVLDVVYNHFGPNDNVAYQFGPYKAKQGTPWGDAYNFEEPGKEQVRNYVVDNVIHWLNNYHCDGLRFDSTHNMKSDNTLKQIALEVRKHNPDAILIPEDDRSMIRLVSPIKKDEIDNIKESTRKLRDFDIDNLMEIGMDAQTNFSFPEALVGIITGKNWKGESKSDLNVEHLAKQIKRGLRRYNDFEGLESPPANTVMNYVECHDQPGNNDGARFIVKILQDKLGMNRRISDNAINTVSQDYNYNNKEFIRRQLGAKTTFKLLEAFINGDDSVWNKDFQKQLNISNNISKNEFASALNGATALYRVAMGTMFITPGVKSILMGDEYGELAPFKFFAQHPDKSLEDKISRPDNKGFSIGKEAFDESKIGQENKSVPKMKDFTKQLAKLFYNNPALHNGNNKNLDTIVHPLSNLLAVHRWEGKNEIFAVMNFKDAEYDRSYGIQMPDGLWAEVLNSNDPKYGGNGACMNSKTILGDGENNVDISIPKQSIVIFKKVN